jgi:hypothetical protein
VEQVQAGAMIVLDFVKKTGANKLLNDTREVEGSWDAANEWLATEWMPLVIGAGLRLFAHIYSPDLYAKLAAEFMKDGFEQSAKDAFQMMMFADQQEAEEWLKESQ